MTLDTPCIGICSTVYGDEVCRGCKRHFKEIIEWNGLHLDIRETIWKRLNTQAELVLRNQLIITNEPLFLKSLSQYQVIQSPKHSRAFLILLLIRQAAADISSHSDWTRLGLSPNLSPEEIAFSPLDLMKHLDSDFYNKSLIP